MFLYDDLGNDGAFMTTSRQIYSDTSLFENIDFLANS